MKKVEEHIPTSVFDTEKHDQEMRATYPEGDALKPAFLYVERGPGAGQLVQLKPGPLVIGRASVSDLRLQHPSISRRHAQFKRIGEQFFVKDLGSQNGTFVNKDKIETEIEVFPGDLIAMGNALLKLRGPLAKGEALPTSQQKMSKQKPMKTSLKTAVVNRQHHTTTTRTPSSNVVKVAIFAGAIGFGLAGVMAFAFMKNAGAPAAKVLADKGKTTGTGNTAADIGISMDEVKVQQNKKIDDAISRKMQEKQAAAKAAAAAAAPKDTEEAPSESTGDERKAKPVVVARATTGSKKAAGSDDDAEAPAKAAPSAKRTAILSQYEKGNADGSLEAAKKAGDRDLGGKLQDFVTAYGAAEEAVQANNGGAAIKNFERALKLDEQLSSGWGIYGGKIRKQLGNLYTLVGLQHVKNDNLDNARLAFKEALKNDPDNERAKGQLAKLSGGEEKKVARSSAPASDDEEEKPAAAPKKKAPAKKPAAEPKSRSQAIDDAFGD